MNLTPRFREVADVAWPFDEHAFDNVPKREAGVASLAHI
jgi:hypothetical protein